MHEIYVVSNSARTIIIPKRELKGGLGFLLERSSEFGRHVADETDEAGLLQLSASPSVVQGASA